MDVNPSSEQMIGLAQFTDKDVFQTVYIDGLVKERRNSSAFAMELRLSCTNPSIDKIR